MGAHDSQTTRESPLIALDTAATKERACIIVTAISFRLAGYRFEIGSRQAKCALLVVVTDSYIQHLPSTKRKRNEVMKHDCVSNRDGSHNQQTRAGECR